MESPYSSPAPLPYESAQAQKSKTPILAWWGIIPTVIFVAFEAIFGWPEAKIRATAPGYALSYLVGRAIGGLLISFVIAWIAYRIGRRSQLAATITFSIAIGFVGLTVVERSHRPRPSNAELIQASSTPVVTSFGAFRFEMPSGWMRVQPDKEATAAMILLNGAVWNAADGMLMVDVGKPSFPTARQMAQSFADKDGRVLPDSVLVDGIEAIRVETPSADMSRPRFVVVVFRDEKVYLIMAAAVKGADVSGAFDQVVRTWRWNDLP
jgi:hypothetical protein